MPPTELTALAARLGIQLDEGEEVSKEIIKKAITRELGSLQSAENSQYRHHRQVVLTSALGELDGAAATPSAASTELVHMPAAAFSQMMEVLQKNASPAPTPAPSITPPRPDPLTTMRTHVKATATKASSDFTKKRALPFAGAGGLVVAAYGLRKNFNVDDLELAPPVFYSLLVIATVAIISGYFVTWTAQRRAERFLRALYDPDVQEEALDSAAGDSSDYFGDHSNREFDNERASGSTEWALAEDTGNFIINRCMYRENLIAAADRTSRGRAVSVDLLSTIDLEAAADDATGLALDRLIELKIIEPVVYRHRQGFRLRTWQARY